jgi:hypothetical protein
MVNFVVVFQVFQRSFYFLTAWQINVNVHEVCTFDRHLPACGKVDQPETIFICTLMQAVLAYRWLMYGLLSPTIRHDLGRLRMPAPAVHKIDFWPPLLSHLLVHVC